MSGMLGRSVLDAILGGANLLVKYIHNINAEYKLPVERPRLAIYKMPYPRDGEACLIKIQISSPFYHESCPSMRL